jgi:hypothetical protein
MNDRVVGQSGCDFIGMMRSNAKLESRRTSARQYAEPLTLDRVDGGLSRHGQPVRPINGVFALPKVRHAKSEEGVCTTNCTADNLTQKAAFQADWRALVENTSRARLSALFSTSPTYTGKLFSDAV